MASATPPSPVPARAPSPSPSPSVSPPPASPRGGGGAKGAAAAIAASSSSSSSSPPLSMVAAPSAAGVVASPPSAGAHKYILHIRLLEAKNLPAMDVNGYSDPYVKFKVGKLKSKSSVKKKTLNPVWDEDHSFAVTEAKLQNELKIEVFDQDRLGRNDDIGYLLIPMLFLEKTNQIHGWFPLRNAKTKQPIPGAYLNLTLCIDRKQQYKPNNKMFETIRSSILYRIGKAAENKDKEEKDSLPGRARDRVTLFVGTWNVGNAPPPDDLSPWIPKGGCHDMFVIGAQECNYKSRPPHSGCKEDWLDTLKSHVGPDYDLLIEVSLWQIRLVVFVLRKHLPFIHQLEGTYEATGVGGVMGNKGGVVVAFHFHDLSLCFINSHLAAHQDKVKKRNDDVAEVVKNAKLGFKHKWDLLNQYHHVFWLGDLNYRLDYGEQGESKRPSKEQFSEMVRLIEEKKFNHLFTFDQLSKEMKEKRVFVGFHESVPTFPPTFKLHREPGLHYDNKRSPAWCDRILWRSFQGFEVKQVAYNAALEMASSDHKPVYGIFELDLFTLPSSSDPTLGEVTLHITNLRARGLPVGDVSGTSDPYVEFFGNFVVNHFKKTEVKKKTLEPEWSDKEIPVLKLVCNSRARLRKSYLFVRVFDWDQVGAHDLLCSAVLPLESAVPSDAAVAMAAASPSGAAAAAAPAASGFPLGGLQGRPTPFTLQLTSGGLPAGVLEGQMRLEWGDSDFSAK